jgi:dipeptidyl aminopeptidase/acylaminoacyl peptidase
MKFPLIVLAIVLTVISAFFSAYYFPKFLNLKSQDLKSIAQKPKPLEKYTYENLSKAEFKPSKITFGEMLKDEEEFTARKFYFYVDGKKVSGLINTPKIAGTYPVIVMLRGFVEKEIFQTGVGTQRAGEYFAQNGYITLAPDFLGYGESDKPSDLAIEERFQTYVTVLTLLKSIPDIDLSLIASSRTTSSLITNHSSLQSDVNRIGIWAHSNGGQIALSVLEITGGNYPTVLWAPVSKPFPYSILYYTDEFEDHGKALRRVVADFEKDYDIEAYSLTNFLDRIQTPIQLHQGTADDAVPVKWSNLLNQSLKDLDREIEYFTYPGADHNLTPGWNLAVSRSLRFYQEKLE